MANKARLEPISLPPARSEMRTQARSTCLHSKQEVWLMNEHTFLLGLVVFAIGFRIGFAEGRRGMTMHDLREIARRLRRTLFKD